MTALLRALLGLLAETAVWCALVVAVSLLVSVVVMAAFEEPGNPRRVVALAAVGAALAIGAAGRAGLPPGWELGVGARPVPVIWATAGAALVAVFVSIIGRGRSDG